MQRNRCTVFTEGSRRRRLLHRHRSCSLPVFHGSVCLYRCIEIHILDEFILLFLDVRYEIELLDEERTVLGHAIEVVHDIHEHDRARVCECIDIIADFIDDIIGQRTGILDDQVLPGDFRHECREATLVQSRGICLRNLEIKSIEIMEVLDFVDGDLQSIRTGLRLDDHMVIVEFFFLPWNFMNCTLDGFHRISGCTLHIMIRCLCSTLR